MEEINEKEIVCPKCGEHIHDNSKFCNNCGYKLKTVKSREKRDKTKVDVPFDTHSKYFVPILSSAITFVICIIFTSIMCNYLVKTKTGSGVIADHKNVNITDTGIAESVGKVYDSVVVVETYAKDKLYATGTGFVFKTDDKYGYILTNNHVIENGSNVKVIFTNNDEEAVEVVGHDAYSDIAVLKVDKSKVKAIAQTGSSSDIKVGDTTFAVGAPLDAATYSWTVTRGILSGKDRVVEVSASQNSAGYVMEVLQTDTAINSGNSGGPLCNANGEVIGITNMKIADSSVEGMGFAIPIETAIEYANHFLTGDPIIRPYLGVSMYDLSNNYFNQQTGIYIQSVEANSPAEKAGLKKGDIIKAIGGKNVTSTAYLKYELYKHKVGDEIEIKYTRDGKEATAKVTLGSFDITT